MVKEIIRRAIDTSLTSWKKQSGFDTLPAYTLEEPPKKMDADLSTNLALITAKKLQKNPRDIADQIVGILRRQISSELCGRIQAAGPGFINFTFSPALLKNIVRDPLACDDPGTARKKILIEFVSANPTGPLHIGHGRGAALGDCLARIMRFLKYRVDTEYYVNDRGNQIEMLARSVDFRLNELKGVQAPFPEDGYQGEYIVDIARQVRAEKKSFNIKELQRYAVSAMLDMIRRDLKGFGVTFDGWFFESTLFKDAYIESIIEELSAVKALYEKDGALWLKTTAAGDEKDRVVRRSDGRLTYLASDIAYHALKLKRDYTELINIWGTDHHGYVKRLHAAIDALDGPPDILTVVLYQLVSLSRRGKPVPMSTRRGQFVTLKEVLEEVGVDACRFFFAMRSPQSQLEFDLDLAKKHTQENPVYYVQYVHARICSIFREADIRKSAPVENIDYARLASVEESKLMKKLAFFSDTLHLCVTDKSPHHLTHYLLDLAGLFHKFYDTCKVLGDDREVTGARLMLISAVQKTIAAGLQLLGVSAPERM